MATNNTPTHEELEFWTKAFRAAELGLLVEQGKHIEPQGAAHLAAEYATAAVAEFRNAKGQS
jgi:hypothetical protein